MLELNIFVTEFVKVVSYCIEEQKGRYIKDNKYYAVDKAVIEELLERNKFEKLAAKLGLWKRLHWIDADSDEKHNTKKVYIKEESKRIRMIVIDLSVHEELTKFCS